MSKQNSNKKPDNDRNTLPDNRLYSLLMLGLILTILFNSLFSGSIFSRNSIEITYNQFIELVESENVRAVVVENEKITLELTSNRDIRTVESILLDAKIAELEAMDFTAQQKSDAIDGWRNEVSQTSIYYTGIMNDYDLTAFLLDHNVVFKAQYIEKNQIQDFIVNWVLPIALFYGLFSLFIRRTQQRMMDGGGGGFMSIGKSNAKLYNLEKKTGVVFTDVAGQEEAKESLTEIVDFLHNPEKYLAIGAKQPKGALLVGPPGTGKTLLAKAVAGEAGVPFFSLSGSEFVEMFVGVGASRVRDLFAQANKNAPCIIFIDEIDAIGKSRDSKLGGNDEREQTLNQLLAEMDGFDSSKGIVILAATNRPEILDKALLRPGRFDRQIIVEKPDLSGRKAILEVHVKNVKMNDQVDLQKIALATSGASGADLANMINEAALRAVRMGREQVLQDDIMEAVEVVIAGKEKKDRIMTEKEKELVAYHEIGHALATAIQKDSQPVQKITIVPRTMGTLGYVMHMPEEERFLLTKEELLAQITAMLAGRAAEELIFNTSTTGASNDIERATKMARSMVTQYGMSSKFDMMGLESIESKYLDGRSVATCSEATGAELDKEVLSIISACHEKAKSILEDNKDLLHQLAKYLVEKETITGEEFMGIIKPETGDAIDKDDDKNEFE